MTTITIKEAAILTHLSKQPREADRILLTKRLGPEAKELAKGLRRKAPPMEIKKYFALAYPESDEAVLLCEVLKRMKTFIRFNVINGQWTGNLKIDEAGIGSFTIIDKYGNSGELIREFEAKVVWTESKLPKGDYNDAIDAINRELEPPRNRG